MANHVKYPYGNGGFSDDRNVKLVLCRYFNQRLLDGQFAKDTLIQTQNRKKCSSKTTFSDKST